MTFWEAPLEQLLYKWGDANVWVDCKPCWTIHPYGSNKPCQGLPKSQPHPSLTSIPDNSASSPHCKPPPPTAPSHCSMVLGNSHLTRPRPYGGHCQSLPTRYPRVLPNTLVWGAWDSAVSSAMSEVLPGWYIYRGWGWGVHRWSDARRYSSLGP